MCNETARKTPAGQSLSRGHRLDDSWPSARRALGAQYSVSCRCRDRQLDCGLLGSQTISVQGQAEPSNRFAAGPAIAPRTCSALTTSSRVGRRSSTPPGHGQVDLGPARAFSPKPIALSSAGEPPNIPRHPDEADAEDGTEPPASAGRAGQAQPSARRQRADRQDPRAEHRPRRGTSPPYQDLRVDADGTLSYRRWTARETSRKSGPSGTRLLLRARDRHQWCTTPNTSVVDDDMHAKQTDERPKELVETIGHVDAGADATYFNRPTFMA